MQYRGFGSSSFSPSDPELHLSNYVDPARRTRDKKDYIIKPKITEIIEFYNIKEKIPDPDPHFPL